MIVTLCLNPTLQKTLEFDAFAHGEVNRAVSQRWDASGKGINVSRVLTQLGCEVLHITQLGGRNRVWFTELLLEDGIPLRYVPSQSEIRCCYTILEANPFRMTELVEEGEPVGAETEAGVRQAFFDAVRQDAARAVIISGSKAQGFSAVLFPELAYAALERRLLCVADYRGADLRNTLEKCAQVARGNLIIKPNFEEFCETFFPGEMREEVTEDRLNEKMASLWDKYGCKCVVTRGANPVRAYDGNHFHNAALCPLPSGSRVRNTIGCGDAFTAGFTAVLCGFLPQRSVTAGFDEASVSAEGSTNIDSLDDAGIFSRALAVANRCGCLNACSIKPGSLY